MAALEVVKSINPMSIMDSLASWTGFNMFHSFLNSMMERNMANNFTALGHASFSSLLALTHILTENPKLEYILKKFSTGYFLYDAYHSAKYLNHPLSSMYIYHHLSTIFYIHHNAKMYRTSQVIFWAELSNIPSYFVYYYIKKGKNINRLKFLKKIQFCLYSFIRLPILSYYTYDVIKNADSRLPIITTLPVYFMGLMWCRSLWKHL